MSYRKNCVANAAKLYVNLLNSRMVKGDLLKIIIINYSITLIVIYQN